ncbi:cis-3-hydroxy-L-proline dehydratase [Azospirillum rugosum]|uniref:Aconitase/putative aconitase with swiveling domain n=1 Tax=Azospirillum rugosum TaxID=416170 RepID=A0ABS4SSI4_9PROT|nr:aconitase family protein [Azospirillum rugosum]MBP2295513.1 putative aconitase/putative aconitase with swiveling domain [Azospirillum rugosum]MDQ0528392.1 putative aconitase/putative aconitase with swiveling domain [Azospirillum rugosum]
MAEPAGDGFQGEWTCRCLVGGHALGPVIHSDTPLSFWGGVDSFTGTVIDRHHPLSGRSLAGAVLAIPSGRGSCSGSGVMLELILNGHGPAALVLERPDDILTLGVFVAEEMFGRSIPVVVAGPDRFPLLAQTAWVEVAGDTLRPLSGPDDAVGAPAGTAVPPGAPPDIALTEADRALLDGAGGRAAQVAMRIILRMATFHRAPALIDVRQAHIDGCLYTGPGGLRFAQQLRDWGGQVRIPTSLNAISVDRRNWRDQGVDATVGEPASALADAYVAMGAQPTFTCAPYQLESAPGRGDQIVWAESNAVVYANSVLGARTMKYPDYLDLCVALTGRAPLSGCHVEGNRRATVRIDVPFRADFDESVYPLLGYHAGMVAGDRIPVIVGLEKAGPTTDDLKAFGAAFATTSSAPMFHILGVTPEATALDAVLEDAAPTHTVSLADLGERWADLGIDLVSLGNPHFSETEFERLAALCRGRTKHPDVQLVITCGRATQEKVAARGIIAELERFGARTVTDVCWCTISEPLFPAATRVVMTNSAKYAHYGPGLCGRPVRFGSLKECVEAACTGQAGGRPPAWVPG